MYFVQTSGQMRETEAGGLKGARRDVRQTEESDNWFVAIATGSGATSLQTPDTQASQLSLKQHWVISRSGLEQNIVIYADRVCKPSASPVV